MAHKGRKLAGPVLYWVVSRNEDTGELVECHSFKTMKEAEVAKIDHAERADPPGMVCEIGIEVLPPFERPARIRT